MRSRDPPERGATLGTARLQVWTTGIGSCEITEEEQYVHVLHCDGRILEWCDTRYTNQPTKCGHVELEVPPGCYIVCATLGEGREDSDSPGSLGNHISHVALVRVNCDDHVCVTLFQPDFEHCGIWWLRALEQHMSRGGVDPDVGREAARAVGRVLETVPRTTLTENMMAIE